MRRFSLLLLLSSAILLLPPTAIAQEATPPADADMAATLFTATLAAGELPTEPLDYFSLWYGTIDPGVQADISAELVDCCSGPQFIHVLSGELTVRVDGPLQAARGNTSGTPTATEEIPPGTEVVLRAGESARHRFEHPAVYASNGSQQVHFLSGGLFAGSLLTALYSYPHPTFDHVHPVPSLPSGALTLTLEQATLAPNGVMPAPASSVLRVVAWEPGGLGLGRSSNGSVRNPNQDPQTIYVLTLGPAGAAAGTSAATPIA